MGNSKRIGSSPSSHPRKRRENKLLSGKNESSLSLTPEAMHRLCSEAIQLGLCENEERYRTLFSSINDSAYVIAVNPDGSPGPFVEVNETACRALGYSQEELLHLTPKDINASESYSEFLGEPLKKLRADGQAVFETIHISKTGKRIPVEISTRRFVYRGKSYFIAIARDLSLRKQSEQALLIKDRAIESAINAIAFADLDGKLSYANSAALKMFGYTSFEEVQGKMVSAFLNKCDEAENILEAVRTRGGWIGELVAMRRDGTLFDVQVAASMAVDEVGRSICMHASFLDITHRRKNEEELRESERHFSTLVENATDVIARYDLDLRHVFCNKAVETSFGMPAQSLIGKTLLEIGDESVQTVHESMRKVLETGQEQEIEFAFPGPPGRKHFLARLIPERNDKGEIDTVLSVMRDITEWRNAQETIRSSEELLRTVVSNLHGVVFCVDKDGIFILSEGKSLASLGLQPGQVVGQSVFELYKDVPEVVAGMKTALGGSLWSGEAHVQGLIFDTLMSPIFDVHRKVSGVVGIATDITQREQVRKQLQHSSKLAAIGTLAAGVAHEIHNPLAIIKGFISVLRHQIANTSNQEESQKILDKQDQAADRVSNIVNGLRTFARADTSVIESVDIHRVIQDTLGLCEAIYAKSRLTIQMELRSNRPIVRGNYGRLQQLLMNLISNAKDACEEIPGPGRITIETRDKGNFVILRVSDNGAGVPKEHLSRIFDPFFTTKPHDKGTGLGLSISQSIIQSFGGSISVESEPNIRTSFIIEIPRVDGQ